MRGFRLSSLLVLALGIVVLSAPLLGWAEPLFGATQNALRWTTEPVDQRGATGYGVDIASDQAGAIHLSYSDPQGILYARRDAEDWAIERVDASRDGLPHETSLAVDASGQPHIAYWRGDPGLWYAHKEDIWVIERIGGGSGVARSVSLALDVQGEAHVAYEWRIDEAQTSGQIVYAYRSDTGWISRIVGSDGIQPTLAIDSLGLAHITYISAGLPTTRAIIHTSWSAAGWSDEQIVGGLLLGSRVSMALDAEDRLHIVFDRQSQSGPELQAVDQTATGWSYGAAIPLVTGLEAVDLAIGPYGRPHATYKDDGQVHYASRSGETWQTELIDNSNRTSVGVALAVDPQEQLHVVYQQGDGGDTHLRWAHSLDAIPTPGPSPTPIPPTATLPPETATAVATLTPPTPTATLPPETATAVATTTNIPLTATALASLTPSTPTATLPPETATAVATTTNIPLTATALASLTPGTPTATLPPETATAVATLTPPTPTATLLPETATAVATTTNIPLTATALASLTPSTPTATLPPETATAVATTTNIPLTATALASLTPSTPTATLPPETATAVATMTSIPLTATALAAPARTRTPLPPPISECHHSGAGEIIYVIPRSAFEAYRTSSASESDLIHIPRLSAPIGWNMPDLAEEDGWIGAQEVWWDEWSAAGWGPQVPDSAIIGLTTGGEPRGLAGTSHLIRRVFVLTPPKANYRVSRATLEMWSDNKTAWYWQGELVADNRESYCGEVELAGRIYPGGGSYLLAIQNSNDLVHGDANPQGTAYRLCVIWEYDAVNQSFVSLPLILG